MKVVCLGIYFSLLSIFVANVLYAQGTKLHSGNIEISFDSNFKREIQWLDAANNSLTYFDPEIQEGIVVNGVLFMSFKVDTAKIVRKEIDHSEFGECTQWIINGSSNKQGAHLQRTTRILFPKEFKQAAIFETSYRNLGKQKISIDTVYSQRLGLKLPNTAQAADGNRQGLVSFQGGVNEWGRDY